MISFQNYILMISEFNSNMIKEIWLQYLRRKYKLCAFKSQKKIWNIASASQKQLPFSIFSKNPAFLSLWDRVAIGAGINRTKTYNEQIVNSVS